MMKITGCRTDVVLVLSDRPGLGLELDEDALRYHSVR
jgi:L-alanine-DL-glutamate epimerase-like enolase superfamily enzyme